MYKDVSLASVEKIGIFGIKTISNSLISKPLNESNESEQNEKTSFGAWMTHEISVLPNRQELVAQGYWDMYISNGAEKDHSMLVRFLKSIPNGPENLEELFIKSIDSPKDFALFLSLFRHLSTDNLHAINNGDWNCCACRKVRVVGRVQNFSMGKFIYIRYNYLQSSS